MVGHSRCSLMKSVDLMLVSSISLQVANLFHHRMPSNCCVTCLTRASLFYCCRHLSRANRNHHLLFFSSSERQCGIVPGRCYECEITTIHDTCVSGTEVPLCLCNLSLFSLASSLSRRTPKVSLILYLPSLPHWTFTGNLFLCGRFL